MNRFAVLLRGVNVGAGARVGMAAFRSLLESLGYTDVQTLLNSGNAGFASRGRAAARHAAAIHDALQERLGLDVATIVVTAGQLEAIVADNALAPSCDNPSRLLVVFVRDAGTLTSLASLRDRLRPGERFTIGRHAAYLYCPAGILDSEAGAALLGKTGRGVTTRNWSTVVKLTALVRGGGPQRGSASSAAKRGDTETPSDPEPTIERFVARYTSDIARVLRACRRKMQSLFPRGVELVYDNYNALVFGYGPSERTSEAIVSIAAYPKWVTLFFLKGARLADPERLLQGSGSHVRSLRLQAAADLDRPSVKALVKAARAPIETALRMAPVRRTVIKSVSARQRPRAPTEAARSASSPARTDSRRRSGRKGGPARA